MNSLVIRKKNELSKKKKKGFTLIELIIVIAIIAILAAIAIPKFGQIRESGNVKADIATAKSIQTAVLTAVSNGDITENAGDITLSTVMDGEVPTGKESNHKGNSFSANISNGVVTVKLGNTEIFPTPDSGVYASAMS
ncbi:prepilin-type N-terminal cleavage/methylation domain-containing protein [Clostridium sp.]|uniref:prepilin-type N-terminal cleavage/methylation domain-containing protein n=1 Tax=Clostridium sp. TaxID=1506 RepID=UPI00284ED354|nr:prepilin-type N-terminal cleavage/methylation domain-containing protein [Clostridium sp.]MDR3598292.1 prepilin-type N-terminal cleavage/methylation domain-containing protein [Clostridium sp.]